MADCWACEARGKYRRRQGPAERLAENVQLQSGAILDNVRQHRIWTNYFDVVILPPPAVQDHAIALSRQLEKYGGQFVLGKNRFLPHISLYHIPVLPEDFADFSQAVQQSASRHRGGELRLRSIDMPLLMTDKPAWLRQLQRDVVSQTIRFFDWKYRAEELWNIGHLPAKLRALAHRHLKEFGSPMIGSLFRPHITLTSLKDWGTAKEIPSLHFKPMQFAIEEISICELGPSHSCQRVITQIGLGKTSKRASPI